MHLYAFGERQLDLEMLHDQSSLVIGLTIKVPFSCKKESQKFYTGPYGKEIFKIVYNCQETLEFIKVHTDVKSEQLLMKCKINSVKCHVIVKCLYR